jgi:hypothetical protein
LQIGIAASKASNEKDAVDENNPPKSMDAYCGVECPDLGVKGSHASCVGEGAALLSRGVLKSKLSSRRKLETIKPPMFFLLGVGARVFLESNFGVVSICVPIGGRELKKQSWLG